MRAIRLTHGRTGVALVAALMLVLQAVTGAFASGAAASPASVDAFGNPLCVTAPFHPADSESGGRDHTALPDCCTVACSMFAPVTSDERASASLSNPLTVERPRQFTPVATHDLAPAPDREPGSPRAPPSTFA